MTVVTDDMKVQDEIWWGRLNKRAEIQYAGNFIKHRKTITNKDLRFTAYLLRCALERIDELETTLTEMGAFDNEN